ncbi:MAG: DUF393 domain-containing protein [Planctomycetes bacterium]|nr:DUF393 domain-containing protein [Planctomycetota bacterium]
MPAAEPEADLPLIVFDGHCNLCNGAVQFVLKRDPRARFRFTARESPYGRALLQRLGFTGLPETMLVVHRGRVRMQSAAALAIARGLRLPWPLLSVLWLVPAPLRDLVYRWIAKHRYRWFGRREACWVPTKELRARFLDEAPAGSGGSSGECGT